MRQQNVATSPAEFGTKKDCAGEDQQQFTRADRPETEGDLLTYWETVNF
jgi:hypothetical protein